MMVKQTNINYNFCITRYFIIKGVSTQEKNTKLMVKSIFGEVTIGLRRNFGINEVKFQDKIQK